MTDDKPKLTEETRRATGSAWFDYLELLDPIRPDLFRYCRRLTGDVWDAEDLVQDTLVQGFAKLAMLHHEVSHPRAYILRIASNLWVDRIRRSAAEARAIRREAADPTRPTSTASRAAEGVEVREAGATLLQRLAPQERAALLLKEVFELPLAEIASILGTSVGAVKSALHRGRDRLRDEQGGESTRPGPRPEAIDRFVERYNARDLPGLLELMLDGATVEMYGQLYAAGREAFGRKDGWFHHNFVNPWDGRPSDAVWEAAEFRGDTVVLVLYGPERERVVGSVMRIEASEGRVARIRVYALCPGVVEEVARELGRRPGPDCAYRLPTGAPSAP